MVSLYRFRIARQLFEPTGQVLLRVFYAKPQTPRGGRWPSTQHIRSRSQPVQPSAFTGADAFRAPPAGRPQVSAAAPVGPVTAGPPPSRRFPAASQNSATEIFPCLSCPFARGSRWPLLSPLTGFQEEEGWEPTRGGLEGPPPIASIKAAPDRRPGARRARAALSSPLLSSPGPLKF